MPPFLAYLPSPEKLNLEPLTFLASFAKCSALTSEAGFATYSPFALSKIVLPPKRFCFLASFSAFWASLRTFFASICASVGTTFSLTCPCFGALSNKLTFSCFGWPTGAVWLVFIVC